MNDTIIRFYRGEATDAAGRTITEVWGFDDGQLEDVHDYIQWLFPSPKPSKYNPDAPLLDSETIAVFNADADLKARLLRSFTRLLTFYGLRLDESSIEPSVVRADNYDERKANWQDAPEGYINHNMLRLTRIMESLTLLGLKPYSVALLCCLIAIQSEIPSKIPAKTLGFWGEAAAGV